MFSFIEESSEGGSSTGPRPTAAGRRAAKSHAMKHVRRRERREQGRSYVEDELVEGMQSTSVRSSASAYTSESSTGPTLASVATPLLDFYSESVLPSTMDNSAIYTVGLLARHIQDLVGVGVPLSKDVDTNILCWSAAKRTTVEQISSLAVQLALLGGKTRDERVIGEARRQYSAGVQLLVAELRRPINLRVIAAAAAKLLQCEIYTDLTSEEHADSACKSHIDGIAAMVRASEQSDAGNKLHTSQLQHIHIMTLLRSLISQRPLIGEREQRAFLKLPATDIGGEMLQLASRIPALMQEASQLSLRASGNLPSASTTDQLWQDLISLELAFTQRWTRYTNEQQRSSIPSASDVTDTSSEEGEAIRDDRGIYWFEVKTSSLPNPAHEPFYCVCVLLLRQALLRVSNYSTKATERPNLMREADEFADRLCGIAHTQISAAGATMNTAFIHRASLHFVSEWSQVTGSVERLDQCKKLEDQLRQVLPPLHWNALLYLGFSKMHWFA